MKPVRHLTNDPKQRVIAQELYSSISNLPLVCPHGHVDARIFADKKYRFGNPVELLIQPDHYILRLLHSQGISYESLGIPTLDGKPVELDPRKIWQTFAAAYYYFTGTPMAFWLDEQLAGVFGVEEKLDQNNAMGVYDQINLQIARTDFNPRILYKQFNIEVISTTDAASDKLEYHKAIRTSGWDGHIIPTFRLDPLLQMGNKKWAEEVEKLGKASGITVTNFDQFLKAIRERRTFFKSMGAVATDMGVESAASEPLTPAAAQTIFDKALKGKVTPQENAQFTAHMLHEMAAMSIDDGLVMQLHIGVYRNHDTDLFNRFGPDRGADFPLPVEFTRSLQPFLNRFGNRPDFTVIIFTLDESTYASELAPLASYYPALKLGPPWWFNDSPNGIRRYFDQMIESGGIYNTVGFNDDTRAFLSIPARHKLWRLSAATWLAGILMNGWISRSEAEWMMVELAYGLARRAYHL
jgi:glucuronate isomerase